MNQNNNNTNTSTNISTTTNITNSWISYLQWTDLKQETKTSLTN